MEAKVPLVGYMTWAGDWSRADDQTWTNGNASQARQIAGLPVKKSRTMALWEWEDEKKQPNNGSRWR